MEYLWQSDSTRVRKKLAELVYHSAAVLQHEFKDYLNQVIQLIIQMFELLRHKEGNDTNTVIRILMIFHKFSSILWCPVAFLSLIIGKCPTNSVTVRHALEFKLSSR